MTIILPYKQRYLS